MAEVPSSLFFGVAFTIRLYFLRSTVPLIYGVTRGSGFMQAQQAVWEQHAVPADDGDTEAEWRWFNWVAEQACRQATLQLERVRDPPHRRAKGTSFCTVDRVAVDRGGPEAHSFEMRRLLRLQGRVREWQRQARHGACTEELRACIRRTWLPRCGEFPTTPAEAEYVLTTCIEAALAQRAQQTIHRWQQNLAARGKAATKWLKGKQRRVTGVSEARGTQPDAVISTTRSLEHVYAFWKQIWERPSVDRAQAVRTWQQHGKRRPCSFQADRVWHPATLQKMAAAKASSSPGIDGWRGDEIRHWPTAAWEAYSLLLCRWLDRGAFPRAWQEMRQVQVPKSTPEALSGEPPASELRPIVVTCILFRIATSAVACDPQVQAWQLEILSEDQVGGVHKRHVHHGIGRLAAPFARGQPVTSLDYAKCFDHVHPQLACDVMAAAGFPKPLIGMLRHAWVQTRFLELNGYVQGEGHEVTTSLPQGDGLAPLALNILMSAPCRHLAATFGDAMRQSIFLDDRAFCTETQRIPEVLRAWQEWSRVLGLLENDSKRAVVTRGVHRVGLGHWLKTQTRILGVDFTASAEECGCTNAERFAAAVRVGRKLLARSIALDVRRDLWRTRVMPLASWGYLFSQPAEQDIRELRALANLVLYSHRAGSTHLKRLLEGHNMDFVFEAGMHAVRCLQASNCWQAVSQALGAGTWFSRVQSFLESMGWHCESPAVFTTGQARLDFAADRFNVIAHRIRAQWREQLLGQFRASGRRDAAQLGAWRPGSSSIRLAVQLYQTATAKGKAVLCGAACSTAYYEKRREGSVAPRCGWCGAPTPAGWEHLVWHCDAMDGSAMRPAMPHDPAARRLGWPQAGDTAEQAATRLRWLASVRERVREFLG